MNEILLGQVETFPQINCNIAKSFTRRNQRVGKVPSIVTRTAINKCFVINMILFIIGFALCSNRGSAYYFFYKYLGKAN